MDEWLQDWKIQPNLECPNIDECSVNKCPLHYRFFELFSLEDDREIECKALRSTRERIALRYPLLLNRGLTEAELAFEKRSKIEKEKWQRMQGEHKLIMEANIIKIKTNYYNNWFQKKKTS